MTTKAAPLGTEKQVTAYARQMEEFHNDGERWMVFRLPVHSKARRFGDFGCCRSSERADYAVGGAVFIS